MDASPDGLLMSSEAWGELCPEAYIAIVSDGHHGVGQTCDVGHMPVFCRK